MHARLLGRAGAGPARLQSFFQQPCRACVRSAAAAHISGALSATVSSALPSLLLTLGHQPCAAARNGWAPGQAPTPRCCSAPEEIAACVGRHPKGLARVSSALPQARGGVGVSFCPRRASPALPCPAQPTQPNPLQAGARAAVICQPCTPAAPSTTATAAPGPSLYFHALPEQGSLAGRLPYWGWGRPRLP